MKKFWLFIAACSTGIGVANATVRDVSNVTRSTTSAKTVYVHPQSATTSGRTNNTTVNRTTDAPRTSARSTTTARTATAPANRVSSTVSRSATTQAKTVRSTTNATQKNIVSVSRSATTQAKTARSTTNASTTNTFGTGYNTCRDAYFTCMDQFCAKQNESYRRCVCSSRLTEIKSRERALGVAADSLTYFKNLNIDVIPKTAAEVKAMLTATAGENATTTKKDTSAAAAQLEGISDVLAKTKKSALSTQGQLDIAGDINAIWSTTDLAGGANIANLTGEALYNAVHAQCAEIMSSYCPTTATQNMVISAYGMYIENDCSALINNLDKKLLSANSTIRDTEREMQVARLENYNAHNAASINDCIASVRGDITADTACGTDFVHCLDVSGRYLNRDTGEPIYTPDFYQLESQVSLSGDILNNQTNRMIVAELKNKRKYAENSLKTCTDLADDVWDEFMRQAIREIYQGQQERIRQVKDECLDVVNKCYDEQSKSLKDFSNIKEQLLLGQRLELSEEMCRDKLSACSNLYGSMDLLVTAMHNITNQKIAKECRVTLQEYAADLCAIPSNDTLHAYPFSCRTYAPGEQQYAKKKTCNAQLSSSTSDDDSYIKKVPLSRALGNSSGVYVCDSTNIYTSCNPGYFMSSDGKTCNSSPQAGNTCVPCTDGQTCPGGTTCPSTAGEIMTAECGDYNGSLYQKLVRYALNACVRPSEADTMIPPTTVLEDVNVVMDQIRVDMAKALSNECERLDGVWVSTEWTDQNGDGLHDTTGNKKYRKFYDETGANDKWGFCAESDSGSNNQSGGGGNANNADLQAAINKCPGLWMNFQFCDKNNNGYDDTDEQIAIDNQFYKDNPNIDKYWDKGWCSTYKMPTNE